MARARNIKPGFYKNEDLAECSVWARFIFPGLWMMADREGRLEDRPKRIKAEILPFDSQDVEPLLRELAAMKFISRYERDGIKVIQIAKFTVHQAPHYSEKASDLPPEFPEKCSDEEAQLPETPQHEEAPTLGGLPEYSGNSGDIKRGSQPPDSLNPDSLNPESLQRLSVPTAPLAPSDSAIPPPTSLNAEARQVAETSAKPRKKRLNGQHSLAADTDDSPVVESIPLADGTEFAIRQRYVAELDRLYPGVEPMQTLREIRGWCLANPKNRKTRSGALRFVNAWFSREQNRPAPMAANGRH